MSLRINSDFNGVTDPDAGAYIAAVEAADGQLLEFAVGKAINDFVVGCKNDGIWSAIKASCILAGARTLSGALVPLAGTAPTNNNFVSGDYNRKTGLVGNGSTKYLNSNRAENADPLSNAHWSVFPTVRASQNQAYIGTQFSAGTSLSGAYRSVDAGTEQNIIRLRTISVAAETVAATLTQSTLLGASRNSSASYIQRLSGVNRTVTAIELTPKTATYQIFGEVGGSYSNARLAFYSIGESLDLALLDARVTALINAFGAAIP